MSMYWEKHEAQKAVKGEQLADVVLLVFGDHRASGESLERTPGRSGPGGSSTKRPRRRTGRRWSSTGGCSDISQSNERRGSDYEKHHPAGRRRIRTSATGRRLAWRRDQRAGARERSPAAK